MKNVTLTFALLLTFSVFSFAQVQYNPNVRLNTKVNPRLKVPTKFIVQPNCPDLAAVEIKYEMVRRTSRFAGTVRITGIVKNVGKQHFVSNPRQMSIVLYEDVPGGRPIVRARQSFGNIPAGRTARVSFVKRWSTSMEFPPNYRVCVIYDPDIKLDGNPRNDDCNSKNNCKRRAGSEINQLFRVGS